MGVSLGWCRDIVAGSGATERNSNRPTEALERLVLFYDDWEKKDKPKA